MNVQSQPERRDYRRDDMRAIKAFLTLLLLLPCAAHAQGGNWPDRRECRATVNKLASDPHSAAFRSALAYGRMNRCEAEGAIAMARVLRENIQAVAEAGFLERFVVQASSSRHPAIFDAALATAHDRTLPTAIRVGAVQIALGQHDTRYRIPRNLDVPAPTPLYERICAFDMVLELGFQSEQPLPGDYRTRLIREMQSLMAERGAPVAVRRSAHCVVYILTVAEAPEAS